MLSMINVYKSNTMKKYDNTNFHNPHFNQHGIAHKHIIISGQTGSGKSNAVVNLIAQMYNTYEQIIIITQQKDEPLYAMLKDKIKDQCTLKTHSELEQLPESGPFIQRLIIFDDFCNSKNQTKIADYAIRSRKFGYLCVFLTQSYFACKKLIRDNCGYLMLTSTASKKDLSMIASTINFDNQQLLKECIKNATEIPMNVCIINLLHCDINKKIRRNFTDYYQFEDKHGNELQQVALY